MTRDHRLVDGRDAPSLRQRLRVRRRIRTARLIDAAAARVGAAKPAVLVSGFWRSGTTWLQESLAEALGAKTVFEPLSPLDPARRAAVARLFPGDEDAAQAYIPGSAEPDAALWAAVDRAMAGRADSPMTLSCRWSVRESFRRAVVVKDVRLQCRLAEVHARYGVPVVHLRRHPCGVVASLLAADWHWSFARVRLVGILPAAADDSGGADPREFDDDMVSRIAAFWAWSERRAWGQLRDRSWASLVTYEDLSRDPGRIVTALCAALGGRPAAGARFDRPSASVHPDVFASRGPVTDRWRRSMAPADAERVERIADAVFPAWRDAWAEPVAAPLGQYAAPLR